MDEQSDNLNFYKAICGFYNHIKCYYNRCIEHICPHVNTGTTAQLVRISYSSQTTGGCHQFRWVAFKKRFICITSFLENLLRQQEHWKRLQDCNLVISFCFIQCELMASFIFRLAKWNNHFKKIEQRLKGILINNLSLHIAG